MLKNILKSTPVALFMGTALWSCSGGADMDHSRYVPVQLTGESNWSILDTESGEVLCQGDFERQPSSVVDGKFIVTTKDYNKEMYSVDDSKTPFNKEEFYNLGSFNGGKVTFAVKKDKGIMIVNTDFEVVKELPDKIVETYPFSEGLAAFKNKDGKYGYIDEAGNEVIPAKYDDANAFSEGYAVVAVNGENDTKYSILDKKGEVKGSFNSGKYELRYPKFHNGLIHVLKGEKVVFINEKAEEVFANSKMEDSNCYSMNDGVTVFYNGGNYGIISEDGEIKVRAKYSWMCHVAKDRYIARKDGKYGIIDGNDETILGFEYDDLRQLSTNSSYYFAREGRTWILINEKGEQIGKEDFSDIGNAGVNTLEIFYTGKPVEGVNPEEEDYYDPGCVTSEEEYNQGPFYSF